MLKNKLFVIKKYVYALNANALRKEKKQPADDCWIDEDWKKDQITNKTAGFRC